MKLTGIFAAAALVTGVFAQSTTNNSTISGGNRAFNLTALNGTWHMAGLTTSLYRQISFISRALNVTVSCPQIYITGNSTNTSYIQPSLTLGWYNRTTQQSESANVSMSGLITLNSTGANATFARFHGLFSLPFTVTGIGMDNSSSFKTLDAAFTAGNVSNPLPHGPDFEADLNITLASRFNNATNDVFLIRAYNFTSDNTFGYGSGSSNNTSREPSAYGYSDMLKMFARGGRGNSDTTGPVFTGLFVNGSDTIEARNFTTVTTNLGKPAANLTRLNDTCTSTSSSSGSTSS